MRRHLWLIAAVLLIGLWAWSGSRAPSPSVPAPSVEDARAEAAMPARDADAIAPAAYPDFLPAEAHRVLERIAHGQAHQYRQDGGVFQNRERQLPAQPRGYYREYTVATPGSDDRGARRIVTGGNPPSEYWYTDDHYRSFRRFEVTP